MAIAQSLIPELEHELASLRKVLERLPADKFDWQPHPRSMTVRQLATHCAQLPTWGQMTLSSSELDLAQSWDRPHPNTAEEVLAILEQSGSAFRTALDAATDAQFMEPWTLRMGDHVIFTMPRVAVIRSSVMNHLVHHRGQLTVYLRLLDIPVPAIYGPSADEGAM